MSTSIGWGAFLVLLAGVLNGSFAAPMKRMPRWKWENTWFVYSVAAMIILPWALAVATIPRLGDVYHEASWGTLSKVIVFGFGWGMGAVFFGLGISRVGMALGFAVILGLTASLGALFPLIVLHSDQLWTRQGYAIIAGTLLVIVGVVVCAIAGRRRERETAPAASGTVRSGFGMGLVLCVLSGIFSPMLNFGLVFGEELQRLARSFGASPSMSANPIWALAVTGGFVANAGYCLYLFQKNRTWASFVGREIPAGYWFGGFLMGLLWYGGLVVYGMGAFSLGALGAIIGWPVFMSMNIIAGNTWGVLTGEWTGASRRSFAYSLAGIAILLLAIYVISRGGSA